MFGSLKKTIRDAATDFAHGLRGGAAIPSVPPATTAVPYVPVSLISPSGVVGAGSTLVERQLEVQRSQYPLRELGYHLPTGEGVAVHDIVVPQDLTAGTVRRHSWIAGEILKAIRRFKENTDRAIGELEMNALGYAKQSEKDDRPTDRVVIRNSFQETDPARLARSPSNTLPVASTEGELMCDRFNRSRFGSFAANGRVAANGWGFRLAYRTFHNHNLDQFSLRLNEYALWRSNDLENFRGCKGLSGSFTVALSTNTVPGIPTIDIIEMERFFTPPVRGNNQFSSRYRKSGVRPPATPIEMAGETARGASWEMERGYRDSSTGDIWRVVCWRAPPALGENYSLSEQLARYTDMLAEAHEKYGGEVTGFSPSIQRGAKWKQHEVGAGANAPSLAFVTLIRSKPDPTAPSTVPIPEAPPPRVGSTVMERKAENVSEQNILNLRGVVDKVGRGWALVEDFTEPLEGKGERSYEEQWDNLLRLIMRFYKEQAALGRSVEVLETSLNNAEDAAFLEGAAHGHRRRVMIRFKVTNFNPSMTTAERPMVGSTLRDNTSAKIRADNSVAEEGYLGTDGDGAALIQYTCPPIGKDEVGVRPSQYQFLLYLNDWGNKNPGREIVDFNYWMSWDHHNVPVQQIPGFNHLMLLHVKQVGLP